jgi:menaquinone-dependent protoporphyrinogen oxidase
MSPAQEIVLVTYATRYGSTQEVAENIAATLRQHGLRVELAPMSEVRAVGGYDAIVCGSPLYVGHWPREAHNFLTRHREALARRPVMFFTLGPVNPYSEETTKEWEDDRRQMEKELEMYAWLRPVSKELFGGVYDPSTLRFPETLLAKLPISPLYDVAATDARDWQAIRVWAERIAETILAPVNTTMPQPA